MAVNCQKYVNEKSRKIKLQLNWPRPIEFGGESTSRGLPFLFFFSARFDKKIVKNWQNKIQQKLATSG